MRNLPFPLVIICLVSIRGYCPLPTTSGVPGTDPKGHGFLSGDYYEYEDTVTSLPPDGGSFQRCDYNPCRESQIPCEDLSASGRCLCPGFTLHHDPPGVPDLKSVSWNGSDVVLRWCEPYSHVTAYIVTVGGQEKQRFTRDQRSGAVGEIDDVAEVCVIAVNDAGESDRSCMMYQPKDNWALIAGLIGGALGFLLLLLLVILLWRCRRQRK